MTFFGLVGGTATVFTLEAFTGMSVNFAAFIGFLIASAVATGVFVLDTGLLLPRSKKNTTKIRVQPIDSRAGRPWNPAVVINKRIKVLLKDSGWKIGKVSDAKQTVDGKQLFCVRFYSPAADGSYEDKWINTMKQKWAWDQSPIKLVIREPRPEPVYRNMT
jgi:hypothetical protein